MMIRKSVSALVSLILLVAVGAPLQAESMFEHSVKVTIPFSFSAGSQAMPAGDYTVSVNMDNQRIVLQSGGQSALALLTIPKEANTIPTRGRLVFQQDGATFYLTEVWTPENSVGQVLVHKSTNEVRHSKQPKNTVEIETR